MQIYGITKSDVEELQRMRHKLDTLRGDGITNARTSITSTQQQRAAGPSDAVDGTSGGSVVALISATYGRGGTYAIKRGTRNTTDFVRATAVALDMETFWDVPGSADATLVNPGEQGSADHSLSAGMWVEAAPLNCNDSNGDPMYSFYRVLGAIDIKINGTTIKEGATFINLISTFGGSDLLTFISSGSGVTFDFKSQTKDCHVVQWDATIVAGGKFVLDEVRAT